MQPPSSNAIYSSTYQQHYYKGHVRHSNKDAIMQAAFVLHGPKLQRLKAAIGTPPDSWDSRTKNWIPPILNQGSCGSCWDFSGTGVCDVAFIQAGIFPNDGSGDFSEQYTLDCGRNGGCGGDDNITVLECAKSKGLPLTSAYGSYRGRAERCNSSAASKLYQIDDWGFASSSNQQGIASIDDIQNTIMTHGCVGSGVAADGAFSNYSAGQIFDRDTSRSIDHDIILTGWQNTSSKVVSSGTDKGTQTSVTATNGWWWLRNSWDTSWGEKGYMRIGFGINMVGSEACWAYKKAVVAPPIDWSKI